MAAVPVAPAPSAPLLPAPPFNVLLLTIDSLRADMPWAGYPRPIAPRLEALHRRAVDYTHAYSVSSFTSKSLGALVSGRYPSELARLLEGKAVDWVDQASPEYVTLSRAYLAEAIGDPATHDVVESEPLV